MKNSILETARRLLVKAGVHIADSHAGGVYLEAAPGGKVALTEPEPWAPGLPDLARAAAALRQAGWAVGSAFGGRARWAIPPAGSRTPAPALYRFRVHTGIGDAREVAATSEERARVVVAVDVVELRCRQARALLSALIGSDEIDQSAIIAEVEAEASGWRVERIHELLGRDAAVAQARREIKMYQQAPGYIISEWDDHVGCARTMQYPYSKQVCARMVAESRAARVRYLRGKDLGKDGAR